MASTCGGSYSQSGRLAEDCGARPHAEQAGRPRSPREPPLRCARSLCTHAGARGRERSPGDKEDRVILSFRGGAVPRRVVIAITAAVLPPLGGCAAGNNAPSLQWHHPTDGAGATYGGITVSNVFVLGAPLGTVLQPGQ